MNLSIDPEKVKSAAEKCPQAKQVLTELFPEVFKGEVEVNKFEFARNKHGWDIEYNGYWIMCERLFGSLASKAIRLNDDYSWRLEQEEGDLILIPTKK